MVLADNCGVPRNSFRYSLKGGDEDGRESKVDILHGVLQESRLASQLLVAVVGFPSIKNFGELGKLDFTISCPTFYTYSLK